jgi:hypothetical protein
MRSSFAMAVVALLAAPLMAGPAHAGDGLRLEPGEWEFTSQVNMPVGPAHPAQTRRECIVEPEVTPDHFNAQNMSGCTFSDVKASKSAMSWTMNCPSPDGKVSGKGRVRSTGKTLAGKIAMTISVENNAMRMDVAWNGKHLGPCE